MERKDKGKTGDLKDWLTRRQKKKDGDQTEIRDGDKKTLTDQAGVERVEKAEAPVALREEAIEERAGKDRAETLPDEEQKKRHDSVWPPEEIPIRGIHLPPNVYSHFLLIDIAGPAKFKGIPRFLPIESTKTLIGRYAKAPIRLDDQKTVKSKHAAVFFEEKEGKREFVLYPMDNSLIIVNNKRSSNRGVVLNSGDRVEIGSAKLIFFYKDVGEND